MTEKILPLPVKKNKFGQRVADISVEKYYRQILEEVLEAHRACIEDFQKVSGNEAEELVDVITCCATRLDNLHYYYDEEGFDQYLCNLVDEASFDVTQTAFLKYCDSKNFYTYLSVHVMQAFGGAISDKLIESDNSSDEELYLADIIFFCIQRLQQLGYDESSRQKLYAKVNDKNRKRGYFDD